MSSGQNRVFEKHSGVCSSAQKLFGPLMERAQSVNTVCVFKNLPAVGLLTSWSSTETLKSLNHCLGFQRWKRPKQKNKEMVDYYVEGKYKAHLKSTIVFIWGCSLSTKMKNILYVEAYVLLMFADCWCFTSLWWIVQFSCAVICLGVRIWSLKTLTVLMSWSFCILLVTS